MKSTHFVILAFLLCTLGCGSTKAIKGSVIADKNLSTKALLNAHKTASQEFNTLAARMQVKYQTPQQSQSITTSLRIQKDAIIWIKASVLGVTLSKILITPQGFAFYETVGNSYFEGDFSFISDMLGTQINFDQVQSLLLGSSILDIKPSAVTTSPVLVGQEQSSKYRVTPKKQNLNYMLSMLFNPDNFMVHQVQILQPQSQKNLLLQYGPYQEIEDDYYPTQLGILALEEQEKTSIFVRYKKIDLNPRVGFPFTIPEGYTQRSFK